MPRKTATLKGGAAGDLARRVNALMKSEVVTMATDERYTIKKVPTGSLVIDRLTNGGFARGRHSLLYGDFMAGKSLIVYNTMALAQQRGESCALVDAEHVFNEAWFRNLGGDPDSLVLYQPENANELGNVLRLFIDRSEGVTPASIVGIDSVASLLSKEEQDYDMESEKDVRTASLARLMSLLLRVLTTGNQDTAFIWTNQWRDKISSIPGLRSTPGGKALGFYASTIIEMNQGDKESGTAMVPYKGAMKERKRINGRWVNCTLRKEKTGARPEDTLSFMLDYTTRQIDREREIIDLGMRDGSIVRKGDYFEIDREEGKPERVHGIPRALAKLRGDDELRDFHEALIMEGTAALMVGDDG